MLKFFSASNSIVNSKAAMAEALHMAMQVEEKKDCDLILFYCTMGHNFSELLEEAKRLAPSARVVGCTCAGVVGREGASETMRSLAVMAVAGKPDEFAVSYNYNIDGANSFEVSQKLAEELRHKNSHINMIFVLASGIDIAADRAIEGIESVFGSIPIFGGTSSDNMKAISSFQFVDDKILERGIILIGLADPTLEIHMRAHHGNITIGMPFTVTKSEENRVFEIEGQPAWPFLMKKLGLPIATHPSQTIPIAGLAEELTEGDQQDYDNRHILRVIVKKDEKDLSFYMPVSCPVGTKLWLTRRDEKRIFEGLDQMVQKLVDETYKQNTVAVFHTDCAARGKEMFDRILKDEIVNRMQFPILKGSDIPWLGMYGFGEFTSLNGRNEFHNYSTSIYALTRRNESRQVLE